MRVVWTRIVCRFRDAVLDGRRELEETLLERLTRTPEIR
jgi:hypothetical protein